MLKIEVYGMGEQQFVNLWWTGLVWVLPSILTEAARQLPCVEFAVSAYGPPERVVMYATDISCDSALALKLRWLGGATIGTQLLLWWGVITVALLWSRSVALAWRKGVSWSYRFWWWEPLTVSLRGVFVVLSLMPNQWAWKQPATAILCSVHVALLFKRPYARFKKLKSFDVHCKMAALFLAIGLTWNDSWSDRLGVAIIASTVVALVWRLVYDAKQNMVRNWTYKQ